MSGLQKFALVLSLCAFESLVFAQSSPTFSPIALDSLGIEVAGASREIAYTNKTGGILYTETNADNRSAWQGWRIMSRKMIEDYAIRVGGRPLIKSSATRVVVYPDRIQRSYPDGVIETVTMLDSVNAFIVKLENVHSREVTAYPLFAGRHSQDDFVAEFAYNVLFLADRDHKSRREVDDYPPVLAVS